MLWVVRWTDADGNDTAAVFEAGSSAEAHYMAARRGIAVVVVEEATDADVKIAEKAGRIWRYTPQSRHTCFGKPVGRFQLACFMVCGLLTSFVLANARAVDSHGNVGVISKVRQLLH